MVVASRRAAMVVRIARRARSIPVTGLVGRIGVAAPLGRSSLAPRAPKVLAPSPVVTIVIVRTLGAARRLMAHGQRSLSATTVRTRLELSVEGPRERSIEAQEGERAAYGVRDGRASAGEGARGAVGDVGERERFAAFGSAKELCRAISDGRCEREIERSPQSVASWRPRKQPFSRARVARRYPEVDRGGGRAGPRLTISFAFGARRARYERAQLTPCAVCSVVASFSPFAPAPAAHSSSAQRTARRHGRL